MANLTLGKFGYGLPASKSIPVISRQVAAEVITAKKTPAPKNYEATKKARNKLVKKYKETKSAAVKIQVEKIEEKAAKFWYQDIKAVLSEIKTAIQTATPDELSAIYNYLMNLKKQVKTSAPGYVEKSAYYKKGMSNINKTLALFESGQAQAPVNNPSMATPVLIAAGVLGTILLLKG